MEMAIPSISQRNGLLMGLIGLALGLLPGMLQADAFGFGRAKPRITVFRVMELMNPETFPDFSFFLEERVAVEGQPKTKPIGTEKGVFTPVEVSGNREVIVLAIDKNGKQSRSVQILNGAFQTTRTDLEYVIQRIKIGSIKSGQVNFMVAEQYEVERGKKGLKFTRAEAADYGVPEQGYWAMVVACLVGLFLFGRMRRKTAQ